LTKKLTAIKK